VGSPYGQTPLPDYLSSTSTSVRPIATTTYGVSTSSGGIGSTTIQYGDPSGFLNTDIGNIMRTKLPFSYIYDIALLLKELAGGTKQADPKLTFPMGAQLTNFSTGIATSSFTVVPTESIVNTGYITQIRTIIGYAIYLSTALGTVFLIFNAI